ncbi:T9SS type A sorting domain-containing protein, partial [bacterium]
GGFHTLYVRAKDANGNWSVLNAKAFYKTPGGGPALPNVTKLEYFIDNDPGFGAATNVAITLGTNVIQNGIVVDISSVAGGFHTLYARAKDANGNWSVLNAKAFYKTPSISDPLANVIKMEYFIDKDPGFGNADSIPVSPGTDISKNHVIDLSAVSGGFHTLYLRAKDSDNNWSTLNANAFYKTPASSPAAAPIVAVEYYFIKTGFTSSVNVFDQFTKSTNVQLTFSPLFTGLDVDSVYNLRVYAKDSIGRRSLEYDTSLTVNAAWLVTPNNEPFVARGLSDQNVSEDFGNLAVANLDTIFSDSDIPGGDSLRYSVSVTNTIVNAVIANNTLTLNSVANLNGNTFVIVTATDDSGAVGRDTFAVTLAAVNDLPIALNDITTSTAGVGKVISVLNNDSDIDGDGLTITSVSTPLHGAAVKNAGDTTITYTALITYSGSDQFTYSISDGQGGLDTATVSITVTPGGTLSLSTSVLQNPALSKYADFYVIADTTLTGVPAVKLFVGSDSITVAMSVTSNIRIYKGAITFTQSGNYTLRSQAIAVNGAGNTDYHAFNVALSKPGLSATLSSLNGKALLKIGSQAVKEETYFTAFQHEDVMEMTYEFGPNTALHETVELTLTYDPSNWPDAGKLFIYHKENDNWTRLRTQVYTGELKVKARVAALGKFKLGYDASFEGTNIVPAVFALKQNYPNPFNPSTTISYDVPEDTKLNLTIYNLLGQKVRTLVSGSQIAGSYKTLWNGTNDRGQTVASGIYFYRLETQSFIKTQKMLLIK